MESRINRRIFRVLTATGVATKRKYLLGVFNTFHSSYDKYSLATCIKKLAGTDLVETKAYNDCIDSLVRGEEHEFAGFTFRYENVESFL
jgi:hypothetical protein